MSILKINDLPANLALDRKALAALRGAGAPWVFGWIVPYTPPRPSMTPQINTFFQTNNYIGQLVDQSQTLVIGNTGAAATITAVMIGSPGNIGA